MSQLSIKLSDKADALIAQLQKEIFNRRRKKSRQLALLRPWLKVVRALNLTSALRPLGSI